MKYLYIFLIVGVLIAVYFVLNKKKDKSNNVKDDKGIIKDSDTNSKEVDRGRISSTITDRFRSLINKSHNLYIESLIKVKAGNFKSKFEAAKLNPSYFDDVILIGLNREPEDIKTGDKFKSELIKEKQAIVVGEMNQDGYLLLQNNSDTFLTKNENEEYGLTYKGLSPSECKYFLLTNANWDVNEDYMKEIGDESGRENFKENFFINI